jgi:hypothetical protein
VASRFEALTVVQSQMLSIKANVVRNCLGPYGIDIRPGGGIDGCIIEGNQLWGPNEAPPYANVGTIQVSGASNVRVQNNQFLNHAPGTPTGVGLDNSASTNDGGLRLATLRFAGRGLWQSTPSLLSPFPPSNLHDLAVYVPLAQGVATFKAVGLDEAGYVVAVVARLSASPCPAGSTCDAAWSVHVQIDGIPVPLPTLVDIPAQNRVAQGRRDQLGVYRASPAASADNQFGAGTPLGVAVNVSQLTTPPATPIDIVVDVTVGFGDLGI